MQLICNQQVAGSIPVTSSKFSLEFASNQISPQIDHTHKDTRDIFIILGLCGYDLLFYIEEMKSIMQSFSRYYIHNREAYYCVPIQSLPNYAGERHQDEYQGLH